MEFRWSSWCGWILTVLVVSKFCMSENMEWNKHWQFISGFASCWMLCCPTGLCISRAFTDAPCTPYPRCASLPSLRSGFVCLFNFVGVIKYLFKRLINSKCRRFICQNVFKVPLKWRNYMMGKWNFIAKLNVLISSTAECRKRNGRPWFAYTL